MVCDVFGSSAFDVPNGWATLRITLRTPATVGVAYADASRKQSLCSANTDSGYVLTIPKRGSSTWYTDRFRCLQTAVNFLPNAPSLGNGMVRPNFLA